MTKRTSKYFTSGEFKRCNPSCSIDEMNQEFLNKLDQLRKRAGIPLVINSAYRSVAHEKSKGRAGTSAHTTGKAVDIRSWDSANKYKIIKAALELGFTRIGVANSFVHVDTSQTHTQRVIWNY